MLPPLPCYATVVGVDVLCLLHHPRLSTDGVDRVIVVPADIKRRGGDGGAVGDWVITGIRHPPTATGWPQVFRVNRSDIEPALNAADPASGVNGHRIASSSIRLKAAVDLLRSQVNVMTEPMRDIRALDSAIADTTSSVHASESVSATPYYFGTRHQPFQTSADVKLPASAPVHLPPPSADVKLPALGVGHLPPPWADAKLPALVGHLPPHRAWDPPGALIGEGQAASATTSGTQVADRAPRGPPGSRTSGTVAVDHLESGPLAASAAAFKELNKAAGALAKSAVDAANEIAITANAVATNAAARADDLAKVGERVGKAGAALAEQGAKIALEGVAAGAAAARGEAPAPPAPPSWHSVLLAEHVSDTGVETLKGLNMSDEEVKASASDAGKWARFIAGLTMDDKLAANAAREVVLAKCWP